jgi:uncharacterized protein (DUF1800 family)
MSIRDAAIAATRFGLGARPGDLSELAADPRGWLEHQLVEAPTPPALRDLPDSKSLVRERMRARGKGEEARRQLRREARQLLRRESIARVLTMARSAAPFRERLVAFWSNHFAISTTKNQVVGVAGSFEREVVRDNLHRSFGDMLLASTRHPGMLVYLDNTQSTGPQSRAGQRGRRGLNENLAREVLELHTLGVDGGYGQADVEALAGMLTGWGVSGEYGSSGYSYSARRHEPGSKTMLGKRYHGGEAEGEQALADLAGHPSTARFVAHKLAVHFVDDDPPQSVVSRLARVFTDSDGHLPTLHRALIDSPEAWRRANSKVRTPYDLVLAVARGVGHAGTGTDLLQLLDDLGQPVFAPPDPSGWPDTGDAWLSGEAMMKRLDLAETAAGRAAVPDAIERAKAIAGPLLSKQTLRAMSAASQPRTALALWLASPDFQRR